MQRPTILVTGATGKTGAAAATLLREKGYPVRALVRREDTRSQRLRDSGAEVVAGSLEDMNDLRRALSGVQRAYFCPPLAPGTLRRATLFAAAAADAKLEAAVALSQWVADPVHPAVHAREKWLSNKVLEQVPGLGVVTVFAKETHDGRLQAVYSRAAYVENGSGGPSVPETGQYYGDCEVER